MDGTQTTPHPHRHPVEICDHCTHVEFRKAESRSVCDLTGHNTVHQAALGCPLGFHQRPLPLLVPAPHETRGAVSDQEENRKKWISLHRRPGQLPEDFDRAAELHLLTFFGPISRCGCGGEWSAWFKAHPPDLRDRASYFAWTVAAHNAVNARLNKPQIAVERAAAIHGFAIANRKSQIANPITVRLIDCWGLGDLVAMTVAMRDLHAAYPGEFEIHVDGDRTEILDGLPGVVTHRPTGPPGERPADIFCYFTRLDYPKRDAHMSRYFTDRLAAAVNRPIPYGPLKPWLAIPRCAELDKYFPIHDPYWVVAAGHKLNLTTKAWPDRNWQRVVDRLLAAGVQLVRVGSNHAWDVQPSLSTQHSAPGTLIDLVGKTTPAELAFLIAHPLCKGTISNDTSVAHLAAAFGKPAIVIGSDRMPPVCAAYPGSRWITAGLSCGGCMRSRVVPLGPDAPWHHQDKSLCERPEHRPDGYYARCMSAIGPSVVMAEVMRVMRVQESLK
jgi:ADP-heptose:LPS heptosyltransferase